MGFMLIVNSASFNRLGTDAKLGMYWLFWTVLSELAMVFLRKGVRTVDVSVFDSRYVTIPLIWTVSIVMTIKKVACLSMQSWTLITVINLVSFCWEVINRITVVK